MKLKWFFCNTQSSSNNANFHIMELGELSTRLRILMQENANSVSKNAIYKIALKLGHDIRTPVSVISTIATRLNKTAPEEAQLLNLASNRIDEIAEDLLKKKIESLNRRRIPEGH